MGRTILLAILFLGLVGMIILQPDASFQASLQGLGIWWNIVFPGLLPFLILFEMMIAFGLVQALASLAEPLIRRLLKLPGASATPIAMGWFGGFPAGSEATVALHNRGLMNKTEASRTIAIAHMPSPIFILVIVGTAFLKQPIAGIMLLAAVWLSAIWLMSILRLLGSARHKKLEHSKKASVSRSLEKNAAEIAALSKPAVKRGLLKKAAIAMHQARQDDGRSFGKVLGDAVTSSVQKLFVIGGLMIFTAMVARLLAPVFAMTNIPFLGQALLESHLGAHAAASAITGDSIIIPTAIIAAIIAWSGISGILQASYTTFGTGISMKPLIIYKIMHAAHAFVFTILLWKPLSLFLSLFIPGSLFPALQVWGEQHYGSGADNMRFNFHDLSYLWQFSIPIFLSIAAIIALIYLILNVSVQKHKH